MLTRTRNTVVTFKHPFGLKGIDSVMPAGEYLVVTDESLIQELSFPVYRRVATMMHVPVQSARGSTIQMFNIDPVDLQAAQERDAATPEGWPA